MNDDNLTLKYFDAEMRYLREAAKEFARDFPEQAAQLNLTMPGALDENVEQLFQSFAFLMGRMREKLDDDLPEVTEGLVGLLWPQYLRCIPSLSIVELMPAMAQMKAIEVVEKGLRVLSQPIGPQGTRCQYSTTQAVRLQPLALDTVEVGQEMDGRSVVRLRFSCAGQLGWSELDLEELALYLNADAPLATALHLSLCAHAEAVYVHMDGRERERAKVRFTPKGFADHDRLWAKGDGGFSDYHLLLEYFAFREKFMFLNLRGLELLTIPPGTPWIELQVVLNVPWPHDFNVSAEHIRLHAVPVINLFPLDAAPLQLSAQDTDYRLRPAGDQSARTEIYSLDKVTASKHGTRHEYVPFTTFRHRGGMPPGKDAERYFHTRIKRGASGLHDTWLILGGDGFDQDRLAGERLTLRLTGTNGKLPRMALQNTVLDSVVQSRQAGLQVRNLCAPSLPCYPPNRDRFHWRLLGQLGSNFLPMLDNAEALRNTLALYNWTATEANRRRLEAIIEVNHFRLERFEKGFLLRGVDIEVTLECSSFAGPGDIRLFGSMLNRFFALYADIHLFNQLTLIVQPGEECLRWDENHSTQVPG